MKPKQGLIFGQCGCVIGLNSNGDTQILTACGGHKTFVLTQATRKKLEKIERKMMGEKK